MTPAARLYMTDVSTDCYEYLEVRLMSETKAGELAACPFCGSTSVYLAGDLDGDGDSWVECEDCDTCGPARPFPSLAIEHWNAAARVAVPAGPDASEDEDSPEMIANKAEAFDEIMGALHSVLDDTDYAQCPSELIYRLADQRDDARAMSAAQQRGLNRAWLRLAKLEAAMQRIVDEGDYTAPEGMTRIARAALLSAPEAGPVAPTKGARCEATGQGMRCALVAVHKGAHNALMPSVPDPQWAVSLADLPAPEAGEPSEGGAG